MAVAVRVGRRVVGQGDGDHVFEGASAKLTGAVVLHGAGVGHKDDLCALEGQDASRLGELAVEADHGADPDGPAAVSSAATGNASPGVRSASGQSNAQVWTLA